MKVLIVASEVFPLVKTGGLADVAGTLPKALIAKGCDARIMLPAYPGIVDKLVDVKQGPNLGDPYGFGEVRLLTGKSPEHSTPYWLVDSPPLFNRPGGPYLNDQGRDHHDNHRRFATLSWAAAMVAQHGKLLGWQPDIVHANDWQAGLIPAYLRTWKQKHPPVVFTIHNLQFTGMFSYQQFLELGLPESEYRLEGMEYYGHFSMLKAAIQYSDAITTVSPTYAQEIQTPGFGCGLDGLLREKSDRLTGILNGVDYSLWSPEEDSLIKARYSAKSFSGKTKNKTALQKQCGLEVSAQKPLFGIVSRLSEQKGLDLVHRLIPSFVEKGAQFVLLGSGDPYFEGEFKALAAQYPDQVSVTVGYDEPYSHLIQAACDFLLVPSRFEPCGLTQLYALRYGTLPIVRATGGLADSVWEGGPDREQTGFVFYHSHVDDLSYAMDRALTLYSNPKLLRQVRQNAMAQDFSWDRSAGEYLGLYGRLMG
ncbi:starch synthase [Hahella sp. CCB-MM4]|uniref:glycogen synthase GlgA n=1 Tax=Hahella sp. (strain CCB-MM4) TaxID=1926491 RepID=UPI000B9ADFCF|nr:glycogen synthase GlgA [Hahella sp. CCB-MM4]OZG72355.1 starch synthase [Hahella sp. CCB-MM4]